MRRPLTDKQHPPMRGFTLIEIVVVVAIMGVLAIGIAPLVNLTLQRQQEKELRAALREIRTALERYHEAVESGAIPRSVTGSGYPATLAVLVTGVSDIRSPTPKKIYFLRRVPRDPFFPDPNVAAEATWGLRAYDSPPDAPHAGADVYDIYSLAPGKGLNGRPYRDW